MQKTAEKVENNTGLFIKPEKIDKKLLLRQYADQTAEAFMRNVPAFDGVAAPQTTKTAEAEYSTENEAKTPQNENMGGNDEVASNAEQVAPRNCDGTEFFAELDFWQNALGDKVRFYEEACVLSGLSLSEAQARIEKAEKIGVLVVHGVHIGRTVYCREG